MRDVDTQDQRRASYSTQIFTKKWWHRVYFFLLDAALTNAFIMHKHLYSTIGQKSLDHKSFQLQVAHALISSKAYRKVNNLSTCNSEKAAVDSPPPGSEAENLERASAPSPEQQELILFQESIHSAVIVVYLEGRHPMSNTREGSALQVAYKRRRNEERSPRMGRFGKPLKIDGGGESRLYKKVNEQACISSKGTLRHKCRTCKLISGDALDAMTYRCVQESVF